MARRSGFPWGLAILGLGGYLLYRHYQQQQQQAITTSTMPTTTIADVMPTVTSVSTSPEQLIASNSDQQTVLQWAQQVGKPNYLTFAQNATPDELAIMARIITQEWNPGPCHTDWCNTNWAILKSKYSLF